MGQSIRITKETREAFLRDVIEHPDEDATRLTFADWLEEHGEPDRAEFIRAQCELDRIPGPCWEAPGTCLRRLRQREAELLQRHGYRWVAEVDPRLGPYFGFGRGFVESFTGPAVPYLHLAEALHARTPLRFVRIFSRNPFHQGDTDIDLARLADLPAALASLESLATLGGFRTEGAAALAASPHVRRLRSLRLEAGNIPLDGVRALCSAPWMARLTEFGLVNPCLELERVIRHELELVVRPEGEELAEIVAGSPHLGNLTELELSDGVGPRGVAALAASPNLAQVRCLDLNGNAVGPDGAEHLARSPVLGNLWELNLAGSGIGSRGLAALARAGWLRGVRKLHLAQLPEDPEDQRIGDAGVLALAGSPFAEGLRELMLEGNAVTEVGARALADSPYLGGIVSLSLDSNPVSEAGRRLLRQRFRKKVSCREG